MEHALMCPQCNAPLSPRPFAKTVVCGYCGATVQLEEGSIQAEVFHKAYQAWNSPTAHGFTSFISLGDQHWALNGQIAEGEFSNVYRGQRARWPTELVIIKLLRSEPDQPVFEREWQTLVSLQQSQARGADSFRRLLPQPVMHGRLNSTYSTGGQASIFRLQSGFRHTLQEVIQAYPQGIPARASIWVWRRILEALSFIHAAGMVHGAILPEHLLIQENEHGVRLVGFSAAGKAGESRAEKPGHSWSFHPAAPGWTLTPQLDLAMSARCMAAALGGDASASSLPANVPPPLAKMIQRVGFSRTQATPAEDAWTLREELGRIAGEVYGPPQFIPIVMPG